MTATSVAPTPTAATPTTAPSTPTADNGTEIVSRSGRKIKPKRFADEEVSTGRRGGSSGADEGQPASKKPKRGSTTSKPSTQLKVSTL